MRWSPLRLVQKRWKAAYIAGCLALQLLIGRLLAVGDVELVTTIVLNLSLLCWVLLGTRVFRGPEELLLAPRSSWRRTSKPVAGFVLSAFWFGGVVVGIPLLVEGQNPMIWSVGAGTSLVLAVLYFFSSVRLRRSYPALPRT